MAFDNTLPKDPKVAQQILDALVLKDQDDQICRYPTCSNLRRLAENGGKPPSYCEDPLHTPVRNSRARTYLENLVKELPSNFLETEQPITTTTVQSLRDKVLVELSRFSDQLSQYLTGLKELSDPEIAAAQIEAAQHRADALIAAAQERVETERSLRLSAENSRDTAQRDAQAAREEAALAITKLQEVETRAQQQQEAHAFQITTLQQEHEQAIEVMQTEAQQTIEAIQQQADKAVARVQEAVALAEENAQQATMRAHDAEAKARMQIEGANHLVTEAQAALRREQDEVARLRQENATATAEARSHAETDRAEIQQLRTTLTATISDARTRADDDRTEIQRLRESLNTANKRADDLALANDQLRTQLIQETHREKPEQQI